MTCLSQHLQNGNTRRRVIIAVVTNALVKQRGSDCMAVNRRAAMRREQKQMDKLNKLKPTTEVLMKKSFMNGKVYGMELATGIIFLALCEEFGFGKKRIERLIDRISKESMKMDEEPTKFNVDWYIQQVNEKTDINIGRNKELEV